MAKQKSKTQEIIKKFKTTKVLVFGDVMLDLYIRGDVERVSPEAPVPIVIERSREYSLGGAGNVAANIATLGGRVSLVSNVGKDSDGSSIRKLCQSSHIIAHFTEEPERQTSVKIRAVSGQHMLLRIDREKIGAISKDTEKKVSRMVKNLGKQDLVVISDYAKGFITKNTTRFLKRYFGAKKIIANIKPMPIVQVGLFKGIDIGLYSDINTITMNANEGRFFTGIDTSTDKGAAEASYFLSNQLRASVVLTRGGHGLTVYDYNLKKSIHIANRALHVFDVTGAGDTVVATLALMLGSGASLFKAAEVANHAGGIVVGRRGTAVVEPSDLDPFLN